MFRQLLMALLVVPLVATLSWADSPEDLMDRGHWKRARAMVGNAKPSSAHDHYLRARLDLAFGDKKSGLQHAETAVELATDHATYRCLLAEAHGERAQESGLLGKMRHAGRAKKEAEKALELDPQNTDAREILMFFHLNAPGVAGGDKKIGRQMVDEIIALDAVTGYLAEAEYWEEQKEAAKVETSLLTAAKVDPRHYDVLAKLSSHYAAPEHQKLDEAERYASAALEVDPTRSQVYWTLAGIYVEQERWPQLDALLGQAEANVPDNLYAFYKCGRMLYLEDKELVRAERYFRKYLTQEPEPYLPTHAHAQWRLGLVLDKQGRGDEAVSALQASLDINPKDKAAKQDLKRVKRSLRR